MIIDTHAHYDDNAFDNDRDDIIKSLKNHKVEAAVNMGADLSSSISSLKLSAAYDTIFAGVGVHPSDCLKLDNVCLEKIKELTKNERVVAIGEIGLDYHWPEPERSVQKEAFSRQIRLAFEVKLPICVHSRDAAKDTIDVLKAERAERIGGVIHCFSYSRESAEEFLKMGFFLGIGGVLTFRNAKKLKEVVKFAPLSSIVLETDCPYMAPEPYRGKRNSSLYLPLVVSAIAELKSVSENDVMEATRENALRLYPKLRNYLNQQTLQTE